MLVSGSGSNLQALIDRLDPSLVSIVQVLSDRPGVRALDRAAAAGLPTAVVPWQGDREAFTVAVCEAVESSGAELVVLAGFMRILTATAVARFPDRILNVHPSLLPAFPGRHPVRDTLAHGVKVTGVTVHLVDELVDHGPIVAQEAVVVLPDDDEDTLHGRIQEVEHRLYPEVVGAWAAGRIEIRGRKVVWS